MIKILNSKDNGDAINNLLDRNQFDFKDVNRDVEAILDKVKKEGDKALRVYSKKFDNVEIDNFIVSEQEIRAAFDNIDAELLDAMRTAHENIREYHRRQSFQPFDYKREDGTILGQRVRPVESAGIYVPGGTASYPSSVLMNAVPAKIAGVENLVMITPPGTDGTIKPAILVAAALCGVDAIYKVGGAHGIAALAYGSESIRKVDKIVGPGNIYVSMAKKAVSGYVGIDMVAGPSEILIIADENADPDFIAADLMGQAEHDTLASAILLTPSITLAGAVKKSLETQITRLERENVIRQALEDYGAIIVTDSIDEAVSLSNKIAPEHLELLVENPFETMDRIENAGSIFLGPNTPEPVGDYMAGPNHTLPTSGTARFSSPLSTSDFQKKSSYIYYPDNVLRNQADKIVRFAEAEGLTAHANAISIRLKKGERR